MSEKDVDSIPRGKNDPPMLAWDPAQTLMYDFNDPDSQFVMFNRALEGCVAIPFSKAMSPVPGKATANGAELKCVVVPLRFGNRTQWWLGIKVGGLLYAYGKSLTVKVSGFRDTDGNEMVPAELRLQTLPKAEPNPQYAQHEQIALRAAQDGIVLMKNENNALPLRTGEVLNFFGRGLTEYRICAVGAGKILPRYAVSLLEAARREQNHPVDEELVSFYACGKDLLPEKALLHRAKELSDTAIFVLSRASGESTDNSTRRGEYCLTEFVVADGNSGVNLHNRNIGFPSGATLCASFDKRLMEQVGQVIGEEAKELGIHLILAPGMNLHRNPLNGRQPEYFSEDPYLAGAMAGSFCKGLESTGTGGCYKHLIANNAESGRKRNQSVISERAIRELCFRAFQYALEIHEPVSVMTAYNAVNGLFTSCDPELIQGLLYEECGFRGFVMTDWCSYDSADVAQMAIAGNAWITPGSSDDTFTRQIEDAVSDGRLPLARLQDNVCRLLGALVRLNQGKQ